MPPSAPTLERPQPLFLPCVTDSAFAMKAYGDSRCLAPLIPNLGTGWRWMISFTTRQMWTFWRRETFLACAGIRTADSPATMQVSTDCPYRYHANPKFTVLTECHQAFPEVNLGVTASEACSAAWILGNIWFSIMLRVTEFGRSYDVLNAYRL